MKIYFSGGLNEQQQPQLHEAAEGSYNFDLSKDLNAMIPRAPFDLKGTATNAGDIRGIMQLIKRDDSVTTLIQAAGVVYSWDGASSFTSKGTPSSSSRLRGTYWSLDDYLIVTDLEKATVVSRWNGSTFSTQTTGLGTSLYAKYAIVHLGRVWLFNVKTSTDTPHLMVASAFEDPTSWDTTTRRGGVSTFTTGNEAFYMLTPDLRPINGVAKTLAGDLVVSTSGGALFKLTGTSASTFAWKDFYPASNAIGTEAMTSIGNDIIYMRRNGAVDLLSATHNYGDVAADDLSRWITNTTSGLSDAITVYDQASQKVLFFVAGKVLVLFKDILYGGALVNENGERAKCSPWSVYLTQDTLSFNTQAAAYIRVPGSTEYSVYFGGSDGRIFDLNGVGLNGDGGLNDVVTVRKTRVLTESDNVDFMRGVNKGVLRYRRVNQVVLNVAMEWGDEFNISTSSMLLKGTTSGGSYFGGAHYFGGAVYYGGDGDRGGMRSHINFDFVGRATTGIMSVSSTDSARYQLESIELL